MTQFEYLKKKSLVALWRCLAVNWKRSTPKKRSGGIWDQTVSASRLFGRQSRAMWCWKEEQRKNSPNKRASSTSTVATIASSHWGILWAGVVHTGNCSMAEKIAEGFLHQVLSSRLSPSPAWDLWEKKGNEAADPKQSIKQILPWADVSRTMTISASVANFYMC